VDVDAVVDRIDYYGLFGWDRVKPTDTELILTASEVDAMIIQQSTGRLAVALPKGDSILPQKVWFVVLSICWLCSSEEMCVRRVSRRWLFVLIPLRGLLSLLLDVYHFFNPCRKSIWLSVDPSHMDCFDVFIPVLVTVTFLVVHLHHDHLVTTFELSHILTTTLNNLF